MGTLILVLLILGLLYAIDKMSYNAAHRMKSEGGYSEDEEGDED